MKEVSAKNISLTLFAFACPNLPHPAGWLLQILPCSGTILLRSWNIWFQEWFSHCWLPADIPHAWRTAGSAEKLYSEQGDGVQRVQTVPIRPAARWFRADVYWPSFPKNVLKTLRKFFYRQGHGCISCFFVISLRHNTVYNKVDVCSMCFLSVIFPGCRNFAYYASSPQETTWPQSRKSESWL